MAKQKSGGNSKKHGRNEKDCQAYFNSGREGINRAKRLLRVLFREPGLKSARDALTRLSPNSVEIAKREGRGVSAKWAA